MTDRDTDMVFIADGPAEALGLSGFYDRFKAKLESHGIEYRSLPEVKDIWCRDFMPIQLDTHTFVGYRYAPDYLADEPDYVTDWRTICPRLDIEVVDSDIVLDGGNVVVCDDKVVLTDKVLGENRHRYSPSGLMVALSELFQGREPVIIPWHATGGDPYGHSDGLVRYLGSGRVLLSTLFNKDRAEIRKVLSQHFAEVIDLEFDIRGRGFEKYAWPYVNYLQVGDLVLVPSFGLPCEAGVMRQLAKLCDGCVIDHLPARPIADMGGALHCITWNIAR